MLHYLHDHDKQFRHPNVGTRSIMRSVLTTSTKLASGNECIASDLEEMKTQ